MQFVFAHRLTAAGSSRRSPELGFRQLATYLGDMPPETKAPTAAKLRWRVSIMRSRAHVLGAVSAPDREGGGDSSHRSVRS